MKENKNQDVPTKEQDILMQKLLSEGYSICKADSISAAGVVLKKGDNQYFMGMNGEIIKNPHDPTREVIIA